MDNKVYKPDIYTSDDESDVVVINKKRKRRKRILLSENENTDSDNDSLNNFINNTESDNDSLNIENDNLNNKSSKKVKLDDLTKIIMDNLMDKHEDKLDENILEKYSVEKQEKLKNDYENIKMSINRVPTVFDILELDISHKDKCILMEKLDILINLEPCTYDYMICKNNLLDSIEEFKSEQYSKYEKLEKELILLNNNNSSLKRKILESNLNKYQKSVVYQKYKLLSKMNPSYSDYTKLREWIEQALKIPNKVINIGLPSKEDGNLMINNKLIEISKLMDKNMYGMKLVKEEILMILNNKISNSDITGNAFALLGKPGVGKTCIIRTLSEALNIPFVQISLGGTQDSSYLDGHSYTYEGATPGIIAKSIIQMGCNNGIIFFDEIDKLSNSSKGKEVAWNLLHITDFSQNNDFRDKYLCDVSIDLSKIWFIYSMNTIKNMDKALKDRMPIIRVHGYKNNDKIKIAKNYIMPKILKKLGLNNNDIKFDDEILEYIIKKCYRRNEETGVRKLEKVLNKLLSKINLYSNVVLDDGTTGDLKLTYKIKKFKLPLVVNEKIVDRLIS
jgi:ATP-dependent Lon protease